MERLTGTTGLLDLELDRRMLLRRREDQAIAKPDRELVESLRGRVREFDVLDEKCRRSVCTPRERGM